MQRVTGHGLALHGVGAARARTRIQAVGYSTVTAFVESAPCASLIDLVEQLNQSDADANPLPISADQLARLWREEANAGGALAVERFARRALVGELNRHLPDGWPARLTDDTSFPLTHTLVTWTSLIGRKWQDRAISVWQAIEQLPPPACWRPADVGDPIIAAGFERWGTPAKTRLEYVGNFQELGFDDDPDAPLLKASCGKLAETNKQRIVEYLNAGKTFVYSPGHEADVLDPGKRAGSSSYATDGTYLWPRVLAHYVERYNTELPAEFLEHCESND